MSWRKLKEDTASSVPASEHKTAPRTRQRSDRDLLFPWMPASLRDQQPTCCRGLSNCTFKSVHLFSCALLRNITCHSSWPRSCLAACAHASVRRCQGAGYENWQRRQEKYVIYDNDEAISISKNTISHISIEISNEKLMSTMAIKYSINSSLRSPKFGQSRYVWCTAWLVKFWRWY